MSTMNTNKIMFHTVVLTKRGEVLEVKLLWDQVNCTIKVCNARASTAGINKVRTHTVTLSNHGEVLEVKLLWDQINSTIKLIEARELHGLAAWSRRNTARVQTMTMFGDFNAVKVLNPTTDDRSTVRMAINTVVPQKMA